uniref:Dot/Icm T4SS effector n=1 Tax=Globodera pallida TaxID=36090 RepID=A0A183C3H1_GLOPA
METNFLGVSYNRDDVFIQSSGSDRALVSAQALLQGMYPPLAELEQFDPTLNWQPIPVHSTGLNHELLKPTSFACPVYDRLKKEVKLELEQQLVNKYPDLFKFIQLNVYKSSQPISLHQAAKLSNINREVLHNLSQPEFCKDNYQALLSSMGLGDDQMVPYSACVMMELYNSANVTQLEIFYRHNGILDKLNLTECGSSFCTADQAIQLLEKRAIFGRQKLFEQCEKDGFCEIPVDNGEKDE